MCGRHLLSFLYLGRHFELEFVCRKITGIISDHAILEVFCSDRAVDGDVDFIWVMVRTEK